MKLRSLDTRPPQSVRVTLDGATYEKLTVYLEYARTQGQHFADVKLLLAEIARAFVDGGDQDFVRWYRAIATPTSPASPTVNGGSRERTSSLTQAASPPAGEAQDGRKPPAKDVGGLE